MSYTEKIPPLLTSTQIAFGDGSNLLTGSSGLIYDPAGYFYAEFGGNRYFSIQPDDDQFGFGDLFNTGTGDKIQVSLNGSIAYYDNTAHTGKFGINTASPTVALDVVGDAKIEGELRFLEPPASGTNYSSFKAVAQTANINYSLPPTIGSAGQVLTDVAGNGVLTWVTPPSAGTWVPTISGTTNIDVIASVGEIYHYSKVNNEVTFSGSVSPGTLGAGASVISFTLPISSNFASVFNCQGVGTSTITGFTNIYIEGHVATDTIRLKFTASGIVNGTIYFSGMYTII